LRRLWLHGAMTFVRIPAQSFAMGSDDGRPDESPIHRVWVDAFEIAACQVTNADYAAFSNATRHAPPPAPFDDPEQPVVGVSWFEAVVYCDWLSSVSGRHVRLPFEAEWECAARGGVEGMHYPWGDDWPLQDEATGPRPVGRSAPNAYGLYDMCENVHEWCGDWYAPEFYETSPERNPRGPDHGLRRVSRGGSWRHHFPFSRCAARSSIPPEFRYADYGFRIARDV
jgi:sulfatase modifying factor 1